MSDSSNRIVIFESPLQCYGRVESWVYYTTAGKEFKPGIYRRTYDNYFKLIGENLVNASTDGLTEHKVPKAERIQFQSGDVIGFRHADAALDYDMGLDSVSILYADRTDFSTEHESGTLFQIGTSASRGYSLKAVFEDIGKYIMSKTKHLSSFFLDKTLG